ncbi:MAG: hypothetical protein GY713_21150 [Actinomycetia bacterium]|nr:hypothetical protein [Actinomycetes bacterium]MCP5035930.1 hypothetical protein [Actinomycetes bacterium]
MNDDDMLILLGESLSNDQPPVEAVELAYASFGWRTLEADLAGLIDDIQVEVVGFRLGAYSRLLTYDSAFGTIEVGVEDDAFEVVAAPTPQRVVAHRPTVSAEVDLDQSGRASSSGISGPVRFEVEWEAGSVVTPWITL